MDEATVVQEESKEVQYTQLSAIVGDRTLHINDLQEQISKASQEASQALATMKRLRVEMRVALTPTEALVSGA